VSDKGLGKGLDALLPDESDEAGDGQLKEIPVEEIEPDPDQPRQQFDSDRLDELTQSIKQQGLIEPVLVTPESDHFKLVAGERRWRAACQAELDTIPALVRDLSSADALAISLVENIQRENLSPVEEARAYQRLKNEQGWDQQALADNVGRSRSAVANSLRLLNLPEPVLEGLDDGSISAGHARALLGLEDEDAILSLYDNINEHTLSVRETEKRVKALRDEEPEGTDETDTGGPESPETDFSHLEAELEESIGAEVAIDSKDRKKGHIKIYFGNPDEFERLKNRLSGES
jgi:ParB family chromosome partitioning protein